MADRMKLLQEIGEVSFTVNDLNLYLDTHPLDTNAMDAFKKAMDQRKNLMQQYAKEFEPLTMDCVCPDTNNQSGLNTTYAGQKHFTWVDGPLPWEGGAF